jgi:hypothetical protein
MEPTGVTLRHMSMKTAEARSGPAVMLLLALAACTGETREPSPPETTTQQGLDEVLLPTGHAPTPVVAPKRRPKADEAAVWEVAGLERVDAAATSFTANVARLACNSGVTGRVLAPPVDENATTVVVTFTVAPVRPRAVTCPSNNWVPHVVRLDDPLGDRALVDGSCLPGGEAETTSLCSRDGVRYEGRAFPVF